MALRRHFPQLLEPSLLLWHGPNECPYRGELGRAVWPGGFGRTKPHQAGLWFHCYTRPSSMKLRTLPGRPVTRRMFLKPCRESRPASQERTGWQPGEEPDSTSGHPWRLLVGLGERRGEPRPVVGALMDLEGEGKTDERGQDGYCLPPLTNDNG